MLVPSIVPKIIAALRENPLTGLTLGGGTETPKACYASESCE